jgi:hypothetical protein
MVTEVENMTLTFRGLSDDSDKEPTEEEISGGGLGDKDGKPKIRDDGDDALPEEEPLDEEPGEADDDLRDDGTLPE